MKRTFADILNSLEEVHEDGPTGYVGICPAHNDTKPSLRLAYNHENRNVLITCRSGCDKGDVLKALRLEMRDLFDVDPGGDIQTTSTEAAEVGTRDIAALKVYLDRTRGFDDEHFSSPAARYAERRFGLDGPTFRRLSLGYDDGTIPAGALTLSPTLYHDTPRLVVPFRRFDGVAHYLQARALEGSPKAKWSGPTNPEGAAWGKYGWFPGEAGWNDVLITEGPGDALTACAAGYDALGIRGAGTAQNARLMDEIAQSLGGRRIVVAGDNDRAGQEFTAAVCKALSERGLRPNRLTMPEDVNDLTAWRERLGAGFSRVLTGAVQGAAPYGADQITAESIVQEVTRLFSDVYNAQALLNRIREQGADIRYTSAMGFLVYTPTRGIWEPDTTNWTRRQAHTVAETIQRQILANMAELDARVAGLDDKTLRTDTGTAIDKARRRARSGSTISYLLSKQGLDAMLGELKALDGVAASIEEFDQHPDLLACKNGIIHLQTGDLEPHSERTHDYYLMRHVDIDYSPTAKCPRWEQFLEEVFHHAHDLPDYMRRLIGYGITGYTSEQCFGVLYGTGANGKSVFTDTLSTIFEGITTTTAFDTFESRASGSIRSDVARLKGSRLVMTAEGEQGKHMDEAMLKRVTGQDLMTARFLYQKEFEFRPTFLILMASNYKPNFRGQDEGIWRRVRLIPFTRFFAPEDRDRYLAQKFTGQRVPDNAVRPGEDYGDGPAGILAWAVRGAREWFSGGLQDPPIVVGATKEYRETSDALGPFFAEYLVREEKGRIGAKEVWELYLQWADEEGLSPKDRWKRATFLSALEERGAVKRRSGGAFYFTGIRKVKPSDAAPDSDSETPF